MAKIWLWEVGTWKVVGHLKSHSLTVTHLEFSYDDTLLLFVSRDRHFSVFSVRRTCKTLNLEALLTCFKSNLSRFSLECLCNHHLSLSNFFLLDHFYSDNEEVSHKLIAKVEAHKRIIWACSWNPIGHQFATSSRDKTVKIWSIEKDAHIKQVLALPQFGSSVTAVAWKGLDHKEKSGCIGLEWRVD